MDLDAASSCFRLVFFFQAEDGIRDYKVTGVQTCALPILAASSDVFSTGAMLYQLVTGQLPFRGENELETLQRVQQGEFTPPEQVKPDLAPQIGRASCRERV